MHMRDCVLVIVVCVLIKQSPQQHACRDQLLPMPGALGAFYEQECGGTVHRMGKPASVIYDIALRELGLPASEVLAVGDSLEHDIAGAAAAGVDALFICGGIHEKDFAEEAEGALVSDDGWVNEAALAKLLKDWPEARRPRLAASRLQW
jgi:ribonucleotide monophosphatase NagD (HAD superfamily)